MRTFQILLISFLLLAGPSLAEDMTLPPVPTVGVSPVLQWVMGVASVLISTVFSIGLLLLKQRLEQANTADRSAIVDRVVKRGALISYGNQLAGVPPAQAAADGLAYVKNSIPETLGKISQATDAHITTAIQAEVVSLNQTGSPALVPPSPGSSSVIPLKG